MVESTEGTKDSTKVLEEEIKPTKELEVVRAKDGYLLEIQYKGGGQLPAELKGKWLNEAQAKERIAFYLDKRNK